MEEFVKLLIYIHAGFGGIGLVSGFISVIVKKGGNVHKKSGISFFYAMLISGIVAMIVAVLPNHHNAFLFAIGIFSSYFVLTGKRALKFKTNSSNLNIDKTISSVMIITAVLMIVLPIIINQNINIVLSIFGLLSLINGYRDLRLYKNPEKLKKAWLKLHIGKMLGGLISATTAFIVVNQLIPGIYGWLIPGLIGGVFITYWINKVDKTRI